MSDNALNNEKHYLEQSELKEGREKASLARTISAYEKELKKSIPISELEGLMKELWKDYCKLSDARNEGNVGIRMAIRKIRRLLNRQDLIDKGSGKDA